MLHFEFSQDLRRQSSTFRYGRLSGHNRRTRVPDRGALHPALPAGISESIHPSLEYIFHGQRRHFTPQSTPRACRRFPPHQRPRPSEETLWRVLGELRPFVRRLVDPTRGTRYLDEKILLFYPTTDREYAVCGFIRFLSLLPPPLVFCWNFLVYWVGHFELYPYRSVIDQWISEFVAWMWVFVDRSVRGWRWYSDTHTVTHLGVSEKSRRSTWSTLIFGHSHCDNFGCFWEKSKEYVIDADIRTPTLWHIWVFLRKVEGVRDRRNARLICK